MNSSLAIINLKWKEYKPPAGIGAGEAGTSVMRAAKNATQTKNLMEKEAMISELYLKGSRAMKENN